MSGLSGFTQYITLLMTGVECVPGTICGRSQASDTRQLPGWQLQLQCESFVPGQWKPVNKANL